MNTTKHTSEGAAPMTTREAELAAEALAWRDCARATGEARAADIAARERMAHELEQARAEVDELRAELALAADAYAALAQHVRDAELAGQVVAVTWNPPGTVLEAGGLVLGRVSKAKVGL